MTSKKVLDDVVRNIPPYSLPVSYISMVKLKYEDGTIRIVEGSELSAYFNNPRKYRAVEARFIVDVQKLHEAILHEVKKVYLEVDRRLDARIQ